MQILSRVIPLASISAKLRRKGVLAYMIWNSQWLIGVIIVILLIEVVEPIPNVAFTAPYIALLIGISLNSF